MPWLTPIFTCSDLVGQGPGPDWAAGLVAGAVGVVAAGVVAGAVLSGVALSDVAGAALPLAAVFEEGPHAVARAATLASAAAANARWATRRVASITFSFWLGRFREPCDSYDADTGFPVAYHRFG
ncbi:MAG: hypothetical protein J2P30_20355 [Actinobacteria bacterium]|nr:hypothetical protein [Actinomycetota bacterium]